MNVIDNGVEPKSSLCQLGLNTETPVRFVPMVEKGYSGKLDLAA